jgi:S-methylmethionine-dependent homocysteine/selenocysteine methylase
LQRKENSKTTNSDFSARLARAKSTGIPLLLDGAMGTELERQGVDTSGRSWTARANRSHAYLVQGIHEEYIIAGADIITTNTFRTNPFAHDTESEAKDLTFLAVHHALAARERFGKSEVLIAGSIAPAEDCFKPELVPTSDDALSENHVKLASWLTEAGVDLLLIETMSTFREAVIAFAAARRVSDLPIMLSLVPLNDTHLLSGVPISDAALFLSKLSPSAILLNCAPLSVVEPAFRQLQQYCGDVPIGVYPNASERMDDGLWDLTAHTDNDFADLGARFSSALIVGSCCGTTPSTTAVMRKHLV